MKKNNKRNMDYFEYFADIAGFAVKAALYLKDTFECFEHDTFHECMKNMHEIENEADARKHEMMIHLAKEFITPIEREDIVALAQQMDNVVDSIDDVLRRTYMYDVNNLRDEVMEFCVLIIKCAQALEAAAAEFKNFRSMKSSIKEHIIEVNNLEMEGDMLHAGCVRKLFMENADIRTTLIWSNMFDLLEKCLDDCEDAADIIESVIMKNS